MIVHRSQRDAGKAGIEDVIEADDGVVPGELDVVLGKSVDDAHGHHIVDGDEGRIGAGEQLRPLGHGPPDAVADVVARRMLESRPAPVPPLGDDPAGRSAPSAM